MRGIAAALAMLLLVFVGSVAASGPAAAITPDYGVACSPHAADWQMADASATPPKGRVDIPKGTTAAILGCVVGGHTVRINSVEWWAPDDHCGGTDDIQVSAWVDGLKIVDKREAGDYANCIGGSSSDWQVWRVLINDRMHLTLCERKIGSDSDTPFPAAQLKPGETQVLGTGGEGNHVYMIGRCTLTQITPPAGGHDPYFDGKAIRRTPPTVELATGKAEVCRALTPAMNAATPLALRSILEGRAVTHTTGNGKPYDTAAEADRDTGEIATYRLDVDNDGVPDTVTYRDISQLGGDGDDVDFPGQYSWTSGKTGKTVDLGASALKVDWRWTSKVYTDPLRDLTRFIAIGGRVYLYKADNFLVSSFIRDDVIALERESGAQDWNDQASRHLYALHPDGTVTQICSWRARKRPEEFL